MPGASPTQGAGGGIPPGGPGMPRPGSGIAGDGPRGVRVAAPGCAVTRPADFGRSKNRGSFVFVVRRTTRSGSIRSTAKSELNGYWSPGLTIAVFGVASVLSMIANTRSFFNIPAILPCGGWIYASCSSGFSTTGATRRMSGFGSLAMKVGFVRGGFGPTYGWNGSALNSSRGGCFSAGAAAAAGAPPASGAGAGAAASGGMGCPPVASGVGAPPGTPGAGATGAAASGLPPPPNSLGNTKTPATSNITATNAPMIFGWFFLSFSHSLNDRPCQAHATRGHLDRLQRKKTVSWRRHASARHLSRRSPDWRPSAHVRRAHRHRRRSHTPARASSPRRVR